jgi:hypothetical protein
VRVRGPGSDECAGRLVALLSADGGS